MPQKIANILSTLGHPLITIPAFAIIALFKYEEFSKAAIISALILGCVIIPISIKMYIGSKKGSYTNFDVSDQAERQSWYIIVLSLLSILTVTFFMTDQPYAVKWNTLFFLFLLLVSKLLNYFIKSSLHVSLNILLAFMMIPLSTELAMPFFILVIFIAISRIILKRHTLKEVMYGSAVGVSIGLMYLGVIA